MSETKPLVSIVTPMHNEADHLVECIESVLAQTFDNWEYTIVDNQSTERVPSRSPVGTPRSIHGSECRETQVIYLHWRITTTRSDKSHPAASIARWCLRTTGCFRSVWSA